MCIQSPQAWFGQLTKAMKKLNYQSNDDHTLFFNHSASGKITIPLIYVDDIIVIGNDEVEMYLGNFLAREFDTKTGATQVVFRT